jgi:WD40 repeat protein
MCGALAAALLVALAGCSSNNSDKTRKPQITSTPAPVAWQRPSIAISQETPVVHLTGMLRLHQRTVNDVAFSANETRMASVGADNNVVVWNLPNGESLFVQSDTESRWVFFGPGDESLITVSNVGVAQVWSMDMTPPRELKRLAGFWGHEVEAGIVVQSPDRTLLAFGAADGGIRLWRVPVVQLVADIQAHQQAVQFLAFSPNGKLLASISLDRGVRVWSVPDGGLVYSLTHPEEETVELLPLRAAFSPDSKYLAVANETGIQVWDMTTGEQVHFIDSAHNNASSALVYSPDGKLLVGCGAQPLVGVWDAASGKTLGLLPLPGQVCANVAFSPDSTLLLTLPTPGRDLYLWNIIHITDDIPAEQKMLDRADRSTMGLLPGTRFFDIAWSPNGRFIVVLDELGPIYFLTAAG